MARIRTIKPEHWSDKRLPEISLEAHLLWIALWNFSDDEGIFEADSNLIRAQVFPRRTDIRVAQIDLWIGQLVKARFVVPFTYNGEGYYITRTFKTHQKIDKPKASIIPKELIDKVKKDYKNQFDDQSTTHPRTVGDFLPNLDDQSTQVEESSVEESTSSVEESTAAPPEDEFLTYDAEQEVLNNQIRFEQICLKTMKTEETGRIVLRKYHLWNVENEKYPRTKKSCFGGFEKWLMNEKESNGTHQQTAAGNGQSEKLGTSAARIKKANDW